MYETLETPKRAELYTYERRQDGTKMAELVVFTCQHQASRVARVFQTLDHLKGLKIRQVALPCSGKLEVSFLLKALEKGGDGVALFGCPEGECRYMVGSTRAKGRVSYAARILEEIGVGKDRVRRFVLESQPSQDALEGLGAWVEKIKAMENIPRSS